MAQSLGKQEHEGSRKGRHDTEHDGGQVPLNISLQGQVGYWYEHDIMYDSYCGHNQEQKVS